MKPSPIRKSSLSKLNASKPGFSTTITKTKARTTEDRRMDAPGMLMPAEEAELEAARERSAAKKGAATVPGSNSDSGRSTGKVTAETMATKQRDISVSEFFAKNRHLLGFDNPRKALLTTVKEAVDNSLDACEEAGILPEVIIALEDLQPDRPSTAKQSRYRITVLDNGPGIVRKQVENVFGRLLFGSKFHRLKMSRGQQGIGISAAGMYGLITTGKPMVIYTKPKANTLAHHIELAMNTKTNRAEVTVDRETEDFPPKRLATLNQGVRELVDQGQLFGKYDYPTGTSVSVELEGKYQRGRGSIDEFLELTAIANPHAKFIFIRPSRETDDEEELSAPAAKAAKAGAKPFAVTSDDGKLVPAAEAEVDAEPALVAVAAITKDLGGIVLFPRGVEELPPETREIQPHPKGIELGTLLQMLKEYEASEKGGTLYTFLQEKFCRISPAAASQMCEKIGATSRTKAGDIDLPKAEKLYAVFMDAKLPPPPTDCLAPIGVQQMLKGMFKGVRAEFYAASSREPEIYRGRPFQIEAAIAFGGALPADDAARVIRFANRVPLLFQQSACSSFKSVTETNWRNYDLAQPRASLPQGALVIMIHMASVWVPFTSESKEAIADYDEIRKEMKLALMECGRKLGTYLRKRAKMRREGERRDVFERYIGEIAKAVSAINGTDAKELYETLQVQARKRTAVADLQLDDEGRAIKEKREAEDNDEEGIIIVESAQVPVGGKSLPPVDPDGQAALLEVAPVKRGSAKPVKKSKASKAAEAKRAAKPGKTDKPGQPAKPGKADKPRKLAQPAKAAAAPATPAKLAQPVPAATKAAKPKMRLNSKTGKLEPVDSGPSLF